MSKFQDLKVFNTALQLTNYQYFSQVIHTFRNFTAFYTLNL